MTIHAVNHDNLQEILMASRKEAEVIVAQVNQAQGRLAATQYVGTAANDLANEMNQKMGTFVETTYQQVNELLNVIVNNMNVVVTKLGGAGWAAEQVSGEGRQLAEAQQGQGAQSHQIDTEAMGAFADSVDEWFRGIAQSYRNLESVVTNNAWIGPEKNATVAAVNEAVGSIIGSEGGTGVLGVGSSLSGRLRDQVAVMQGA